MTIDIYQVDAFASTLFSGNPAAVCPLHGWISDELMQSIAAENNLAETAFFVPAEKGFHLRWFTPVAEVDLCGHATLATAHVLFEHLGFDGDHIHFTSKSGDLSVTKNGARLVLNFPADQYQEIDIPTELVESFDLTPQTVLKGTLDYVFIYNSQEEIENIQPRLDVIASAKSRGIIISAPGNSVDFVSRYFAPQFGIPEDPVTGSAHTLLTPYWSKVLDKSELSAVQLSSRKGELQCTLKGDRVHIGGYAVSYLEGKISVN